MKKTLISNLKQFAKENKVPIIEDEGLHFLLDIINNNEIKTVLEIGAAIGYSAINMAFEGVEVITLERDVVMYEQLVRNIEKADLKSKVFPIFGDALNINVGGKFDLIFIDAAKAQYQKFFEKFSSNLTEEGIIICDNLNFHNLDPNKVSRHTRQLLKKIESFKEFLKNNEQYDTTFYNVGDGMSVSKRKIT